MTLQIQLHEEIHLIPLLSYTYFAETLRLKRSVLVKIAHLAMSEVASLVQHDIFVDGTVASDALVLVFGRLRYVMGATAWSSTNAETLRTSDCMVDVEPHRWVCDAVLWVKWSHRGVLTSSAPCEILRLSAIQFISTVADDVEYFSLSRKFAVYFAEYTEDHAGEMTDISLDHFQLVELFHKASHMESRMAGH